MPICKESIISQPSNQNIIPGNNAQFVVATNNSNASYQWQTDLGFGFQNLSNAGQYSGVTNDTLMISNITILNNNQNFRCIISNGSCTDSSVVVNLTINTTGISEIISASDFVIYPNPANDFLNLKVKAALLNNTYTFIDQLGRIVLSGKINTETSTINIRELSKGIYYFRFKDSIVTKKIIVIK